MRLVVAPTRRDTRLLAKGQTVDGEQTVLVTGGSGFLGGWCLAELLKRGYRVRTTVRSLAREAEVRANVGSQVDTGDRLTVLAADLTKDDGWAEAIGGCDYILHVASPFPPAQPKDPDELIVPAREGTLRVLRESIGAGVKRVVVTSSVAAVRHTGSQEDRRGREFTEADWSDPDNADLTPYTRSKTIAELAAWEYMRAQGQEARLVTVQPGAIIGPVLGDDRSYSLQAVERMLTGRMPGLPRLGFSFIDVRDVAALEVKAMAAPDAAGQRLIAAGSFLWLSEVATILRDQLGADARKVPRRSVPNLLVRALALFDPELRSVVGDLREKTTYSLDNAKRRVGWVPRPVEESIVDCARSLLGQPAPTAAASRA
jgi:nucleoside-diphosphate-sugar epimerase